MIDGACKTTKLIGWRRYSRVPTQIPTNKLSNSCVEFRHGALRTEIEGLFSHRYALANMIYLYYEYELYLY